MAYCGPKGVGLHEFLAWPEWAQDAALMWQDHEARRHAACGTHPEDWAGRAEPQHWHGEVCPGCAARETAQAELDSENDHTRGLGLVAVDGPRHTCPQCTDQ